MRLHRDLLSNRGLLGLLLVLFLHYVLLLPAPSAASPLRDSVDLLDTLNLTSTIEPRVLAKRYYKEHLTGAQNVPEKAGIKPPPISDYPNDDTISRAFRSEVRTRPFVFYCMVEVKPDNGGPSVASSTVARNFAKSLAKTTLPDGGVFFRDCYPDRYTVQKQRGETRRSDTWYQDFADRFSGVMADNASGEVYFLFNRLDWTPEDPGTKNRVWTRIEYPTLIQNPAVTKITIVHWDIRNNVKLGSRTLWLPGDNAARAVPVNETAVLHAACRHTPMAASTGRDVARTLGIPTVVVIVFAVVENSKQASSPDTITIYSSWNRRRF
ncbi:hypothetical protein BDW59DRAFT_160412 [Aspergillus cavernicola]|uniref:Uncharacterized protein n=1 Tax=Aspergillus cavernicola TaxID=176166 RepID=A0ABR4IHA6_9EURO